MMKWLTIILLSACLISGCATQNSGFGPNSSEGKQPAGATNFKAYDKIVTDRITTTWKKILKNQYAETDNDGEVILKFTLHSDGTVSNIKTIRDDCGFPFHYYCVRAIEKSAPFPIWTPEMTEKLGDHLDVQFTFNYSSQ